MHLATLLTTTVLPILALSSPALPVGPPVSIPAVVPTPVASQAASAIANLPVPVSIPVALPTAVPTAVPSTGGESSLPTALIPHLGIPPATLLNNIEAALDILGIVATLLDPASALSEGITLPPGGFNGQDINGELVTTLVTLATDLLSLAPGGAPGADVPK